MLNNFLPKTTQTLQFWDFTMINRHRSSRTELVTFLKKRTSTQKLWDIFFFFLKTLLCIAFIKYCYFYLCVCLISVPTHLIHTHLKSISFQYNLYIHNSSAFGQVFLKWSPKNINLKESYIYSSCTPFHVNVSSEIVNAEI